MKIPKGFFPQQDTGRINGSIQGDQDISFQEMRNRITQLAETVIEDPAVDSVMAFNGGGFGGRPLNTGSMFLTLKPLAERKINADQVIARLRQKLARIPAVTLYLQPVQDLRVGGRSSNAQYQYTLQSDNVQDLLLWGPRMLQKLKTVRGLLDVNSDQQNKGLAGGLGHRPSYRRQARDFDTNDRQHTLRRLRSATGIDHVHPAQSVPCRAGGGTPNSGKALTVSNTST